MFNFKNGVFVPEEDFDGGPLAAPTDEEAREMGSAAVERLAEMGKIGVAGTDYVPTPCRSWPRSTSSLAASRSISSRQR